MTIDLNFFEELYNNINFFTTLSFENIGSAVDYLKGYKVNCYNFEDDCFEFESDEEYFYLTGNCYYNSDIDYYVCGNFNIYNNKDKKELILSIERN